MRCDDCGIDYPQPEPRLFSFNSPLGACPTCEGFGNVIDIDMDLVVPDPSKIAARRGDRAVEHAGLCARAGRAAGAGRRLRPAGRCAVSRADDRAAAADSRRRAGAELRRARTASSPGWSGASTRCTCACFSAAGAATAPARRATAARLRPEALAVADRRAEHRRDRRG